MYATRPLTISQINDLKAWTAYANEADQLTAEYARQGGEKDDGYRAKERELIRLEREERVARDQERWRRERRRRELEREIAWEERKKDEWRRYFRQRAVAEEEARKATKLEAKIRRMEILGMESMTLKNVEDDEDIPDESEWRKEVLRRRFRAGNRWSSGHFSGAAPHKKSGKRYRSRSRSDSYLTRYLIQENSNNLDWEAATRTTQNT